MPQQSSTTHCACPLLGFRRRTRLNAAEKNRAPIGLSADLREGRLALDFAVGAAQSHPMAHLAVA